MPTLCCVLLSGGCKSLQTRLQILPTIFKEGRLRIIIATVGVLGVLAGCRPAMPVLSTRADLMSGEALHAAVSRLTLGECRTRLRKADGPGNVSVQICAYQGAQDVDGPNARSGVPVARMRNMGNRETALWNLRPHAYESYIIARWDSLARLLKYDIIEVSTMSPPAEPLRVVVHDGVYRKCGHQGTRPAVARASFGECAERPGNPDTDPADKGVVNSQMLSTGPAWIVCGGDCCVTDPK